MRLVGALAGWLWTRSPICELRSIGGHAGARWRDAATVDRRATRWHEGAVHMAGQWVGDRGGAADFFAGVS